MYDNTDDAIRYLSKSIIRYGKKPVVLIDFRRKNGSIIANGIYLHDSSQFSAALDDPLMDYTPVPLGYGQDAKGRVYFAYRMPRRRWKQGLHEESLAVADGSKGFPQLDTKADRKQFADMILGKHLTFKKAKENGGVFHRFFRLVGLQPFIIEYKGQQIGHLNGDEVLLDEPYQYLDKLLKEVMA